MDSQLPSQAQNFITSVAMPVFISSSATQGSRYHHRAVLRKRFDFDEHMAMMTSRQFKQCYRLDKYDFTTAVETLFPDADPGPNDKYAMFAFDPRVRLAVALRTLAGAKLLDLWWPYCIGQSSVYSVFHDILRRSCTYLDNVKFPSSEDECKAAADGFQNLRDSPLWGIVAALDGISVSIKCPTLDDTPSPNFFYNRKGFYSVCVQAACDASYNFYFFSASNAGSTHDSTAFQTSVLHTHLQKAADDGGLPYFATVAADDAYGNGTCGGRILTPCSGRNLSSAMDTFNFFLSSNRITI